MEEGEGVVKEQQQEEQGEERHVEVIDTQRAQQEVEEIWSWGAGTEGQLGRGRQEDEHSPQLLNLSNSLSSFGSISLLACGGAHVVALTSGGKVLSWGRGSSGQLGHVEIVPNCLYPKLVDSLASFNISNVSAGWNHSGFVSGNSGNEVYGFGSGKRGQLGVSKDKIKSLSLPQLCSGFEGAELVNIIANGDHSAALSANGQLFTWGRGFSCNSDVSVPQTLPSSLRFKQAALGWNHALVLTGEGEVFMLGGRHHGALSEPPKAPSVCDSSGEAGLSKVAILDGKKVVQIAAGAEHSAIATEDGQVCTWGWGEHGQLGLGGTSDQTLPQVVDLSHKPGSKPLNTRVHCGSGFTIAVKRSALSG